MQLFVIILEDILKVIRKRQKYTRSLCSCILLFHMKYGMWVSYDFSVNDDRICLYNVSATADPTHCSPYSRTTRKTIRALIVCYGTYCHVLVTRRVILIGNWIYLTLISRN
jgi:hypothetical protein